MAFRFRMEKRSVVPRKLTLLVLILSLVGGLLVAGLFFLLKGVDPIFAYQKIFMASFGSVYGWLETLTKAIPLMIIALGLALAFKALFWNIGAEGQLLLGAIAGTYVALNFSDLPSVVLLPLMFLAGFIAGGIWGLIPTILKVKLKVNEVIVTLMLNYIAIELVNFLVYGPWKGGPSLVIHILINFRHRPGSRSLRAQGCITQP